MQFGAISQVEGYWRALFDTLGVPPRRMVDPRGLEQALEYAFILERVTPRIGRIRVAGQHLNDLMGMEVRGMPFSALFSAAARPRLAEAIEALAAGDHLADMTLDARAAFGRPRLEGRLFMAPLAGDDGRIDRILGCLQTSGRIGQGPRRLDISSCSFRAPDAPAPAGWTPRQVACAEDPRPFDRGTRPALRLVYSAD